MADRQERACLRSGLISKSIDGDLYEANEYVGHRNGGVGGDDIGLRQSRRAETAWLARPQLAPPGTGELFSELIEAERCSEGEDSSPLADGTAQTLSWMTLAHAEPKEEISTPAKNTTA